METIESALEISEADAVRALAALAQPQRLRVFRALVAAEPAGLTPGAIAEALAIPASTLSFHLKELANAGLVVAAPRGRSLDYRVRIDRMAGLMAYLAANCCAGEACAVDDAAQCLGCE